MIHRGSQRLSPWHPLGVSNAVWRKLPFDHWACTDFGFVAQVDFSLTPEKGYGYVVAPTGGGKRNRSQTNPQLAGVHFGTNNYSYRIDLPSGAGKYRVHAAFCDSYPIATYMDSAFLTVQGSEIAYVNGLDTEITTELSR